MESTNIEPIAIIGIGCRIADQVGPEAYFRLLCEGIDATREVPANRWNLLSFYDTDRRVPGKLHTNRGGFLSQIDEFDAAFFGISPREASYLDPQQRLMLEVTWEALEDAGIVPERLSGGSTGVFVGAFTLDYKALQMAPSNLELIDAHTATGTMMTMMSNRISYVFDLRGPSVSVDTACSSSLVAVHLACQSLRNGECNLALAGGVNVMILPEHTVAESKGGFLAPDGRSKPFSALADGYGRGEGAGMVVLKPLSAALAHNDPIYAVIRGSAVNQDGHTHGITVPSGEAQEALIREACKRAGVSPGKIRYVEAHGTGTPVGDPIEAKALGSAFSDGRAAGERCLVGSVKGNIGHLEAAAGIAGLIKTVMSLQHKRVPPNLHCEQLNPSIPFEDLALRIPRNVEPWPSHAQPALAGVNSFGFGGTNAHVVLQEGPSEQAAPEVLPANSEPRPLVFPISARTPEALKPLAEAYLKVVRAGREDLANLLYSASVRRTHHDHRLAIVAGTGEELAERLEAYLTGEETAGVSRGERHSGRHPKLVWVFTGMGPQWWAMGRQLFNCEAVFRDAILECDRIFRAQHHWSLTDELLASETASRMAETQVAQTANFAIQVALARLWQSWGIQPDAVVGHSVGEVAAATVSGALSLEDGVRVSFHRSRIQQKASGKGAMLATALNADEAFQLLRGYEGSVSIAAVNGPQSTTLSGDPASIQELAAVLTDKQVFNRVLKVDVAYHSYQMDPLREELLHSLKSIQPSAGTIPLYSTVDAARMDGNECSAAYWWRNVRNPVVFHEAMDALIDNGFEAFLEIGPHPVLSTSISECLTHRGSTAGLYTSLRRGKDELASLLGSLAALYTAGFSIQWENFRTPSARFVRPPAYPWQRQRYWNESEISREYRIGAAGHPLLGRSVPSPNSEWNVELSTAHSPYLKDHCVQGAVVFPGAGYVEMGLAAARGVFADETYSVENIRFQRALFLPEGERPKVRLTLDRDSGHFAIYSVPNAAGQPWVMNASGELQPSFAGRREHVDLHAVQGRCAVELSSVDCYLRFRRQGFEYGREFQKIDRIWIGADEALARFEQIPENDAVYQLHPAFLDACFQVLIATNPFGEDDEGNRKSFLPVGIDRIRVHRRPSGLLWGHASITERKDHSAKGSIHVFDDSGNIVLEIEGFLVQLLDQAARSVTERQIDSWLYAPEWELATPVESVSRLDGRPATWMIFVDRTGAGSDLAERLESRGESVILVSHGDHYQAAENGFRYVVNPAVSADFERLIADARSSSVDGIAGIQHFWSLDAAEPPELTAASFNEAQDLGCMSLMHLTQALMKSNLTTRIWVITRGAQSVTGREPSLSVAQSPVWGLGRVIGHQECAWLWGGLIDLDPNSTDAEGEQLLGEIRGGQTEDQVALRDGQRHVLRLKRIPKLNRTLPPRFRANATYLITGGLGALGLLTAKWMVASGARRLVLMGRTPLPARAEWWSAAQSKDTAERTAAIREIEAKGANITIAPVDVADEEQFSAFLEQHSREGWPAIRGVVHSAGLVRDQLLMNMDAETFATVVRPKLYGAWNLHRYLNPADLDFFILFSSIGSLVVSPGQANYAAANAFLDALAHYRRNQGYACQSVNWGPWAVGMVKDLNLVDYYRRQGLEAITEQHGMQALSRIFGDQSLPQIAVLDANWRLAFEHRPQVPPMIAHLALDSQSTAVPAEDTNDADVLKQLSLSEPGMRSAKLEIHLQELTARVLRIERARIALDQPLTSLGLDSLMASELKARLEASLKLPVSVLDLLKGLSLSELAAALLPRLALDEDKELAELADEIELLSADQIEALLNEAPVLQ